MNDQGLIRLGLLRADYQRVVGRPFSHFFCPVLFKDEPVPLSEGHVINVAFPDSDRHTIIQRRDVDSFFGSRFEADFVLMAQKGKHDALEVLLDRELSRRLRPRFVVDGRALDHYFPKGAVPPTHSELSIEREGQPPVRLALKVEPSETLAALDGKWEIDIQKDIRLSALVSLVKAAHLTLFALMGYSYALTAGGHFFGWDVLGRFVAANMTNDRPVVLASAARHFAEFVNLVRPMLVPPAGLEGTISDRQLFLCTGTPKPWAFMVCVRTGNQMHAVLVPIMEDPESAARFVRFLREPAPRFEVRRLMFAGDRWEGAKDERVIEWPEARFEWSPNTDEES